MIALSEDIIVPRKYGPLVERGISLREIRAHNKYEIWTMLKSIDRHGILVHGQNISEEMRKDPNSALLFSKYMDEVGKFREQRGTEDGEDD